jgi:hypothetical protein
MRLNIFLKNANRIFLIFLVDGHLKYIYAFSTSKVKIIIYQYFNLQLFFNTIPLVKILNTFDLLLVH